MDRKMVEEEAKNRRKMIIKASKSMSSPSRTEKFPPPLMRFLRSNASSKSRGRSRSSPMFFRKKNNASAAAATETTQEPSSPKVTCIGQVRVRRSSNSNNKSKAFPKSHSSKPKRNNSSSSASSAALAEQVPCWWVHKALCCHGFFPRFHKPRCSCPLFFKWVKCFRFGYCRKVDTRDDSSSSSFSSNSSRIESMRKVQNHATSDDTDDQIQESKQDFVGSTPPKNALLLTRCRSAPYRSSSLASRFWGSPLKDNDDDEAEEDTKVVKSEVQDQLKPGTDEQERPVSAMCRDEMVAAEPRFSSRSEDLESSSADERSKVVAKSIQDLRAAAVHPLVLTRCKSEPARTAERLINPDASQPSSQDNP